MFNDFSEYILSLFDKNTSKIKFLTIPIIILGIIIFNDITGYFYYNNISNKVDNIIKIENFKKEHIKNYNIEESLILKINDIEKEIIDKKSNFFETSELFFKNIYDNFYLFLSIHFIWIIAFIFLVIKGLPGRLGDIFLIVFFGMFVWQTANEILYFLINQFIYFEKNIFLNMIFSIVSLFIVGIFGKNKK